MRLKRLLAGVLVMLTIDSTAYTSAYAAAEDNKTESPTELIVSQESVGREKYLRYLENRTYFGNFGATYSKKETVFKLWSPAAQSVKVCIYSTGTDDEEGAELISTSEMELYEKYGTWVLHLKGDHKNKYYTYLVTVNGQTNEVVDPYAKAVGANGNRGMIVDLNSTDPEGWNDDDFVRVDDPNEAIIWEVSVRDFSASESSGVSEKNRGKFLAFTEEGTVVDSVEGSLPTCIDYLTDLGVNYVQINPFYDFNSIDETDTVTSQYNWGYDPKNYNVPEGSYSSNPYDGNVRIKECKQMIQALHNAGIGVIMDVVYNHTYFSKDSWFNLIVPDYYYRMDESGNWSNGSGCGNDTASERVMFRNFMKDSVVYWAQEYHIDGFRFDLMGLHDVETMNLIRKSLDELPYGEKIIMYGEAWELNTACDSDVKLANQNNISLLSDRIGAFNDTMRDGLKGNVFDSKDQGFIQSGSNRSKVKSGIEGMSTPGTWEVSTKQNINYASCHDNLSLYDKLVASVYPDEVNFRKRREDLVSMNKLSAAVILTSQGVPFMMAGEEMARSKDGDENSYKSPVELNQIDWTNLYKYADLVDYYKGLIDIRNTVDLLKDSKGKVAKSIKYIDDVEEGVIAYTATGSGNTKGFAAVFNGRDEETTVNLPKGMAKVWIIVANDKDAGIKNLGQVKDAKVTVAPHSCVLLVNKTSFDKYPNKDTKARVIVKYHDTKTDSIIYEQLVKGKVGKEYSLTHPNTLIYDYNIKVVSGSLTGEFTEGTTEVLVDCTPQPDDYSSVTIHYVDENGENIANSVVMTNKVGESYTTTKLAGIDGYSLDLDKLPDNGAGEYTEEPITVTYTYKKSESSELCMVNVIYMGDSGEILNKNSFAGDEGTEIVIEYLDFEDYLYVSDTMLDDALFSKTETNIIVNYEKQVNYLMIALIAGGGVLLLIIAIAVIYRKKRKQVADDKDIVNDLYID